MMNDSEKPETDERNDAQQNTAAEQPAEDAAPAEAGADMAEDRLPALEAEVADLKDRLLRALAEVENVRRRAERDKEETSKYAVTSFARDLLNVADNLRRALDSLPAEMRENEALQSFLTGIEMTEKELLNSFEKQGISPVNPAGEKFDHNYHQAMFEVESADQAPGTVVQVMQTGYVIKDRLLRPAMVGVAKAPAGDQSGDDQSGESGGNVDTSA